MLHVFGITEIWGKQPNACSAYRWHPQPQAGVTQASQRTVTETAYYLGL